jgi:hypothetical protein
MAAKHQKPSLKFEQTDAGSMAQALCRSCGFCCDGTLFSSVTVCASDDIDSLANAGIRIVPHDAERVFSQPCVAHNGRSCKVYGARPSNCHEFRCKLLRDLESGAVDWSLALKRVSQVFALKEEIRETLQRIDPTLIGMSLSGLRKRWTDVEDPAESLAMRRKYGPALICMVALANYLERHFHEERKADNSPPACR